jgi:prolyl 4-hydroxylase
MKKITYQEDVFVIEDFLTHEECNGLITIAEQIGFEEAKVQVGAGAQAMLKGVRNNERILYKNQELAQQLWEQAKPYMPFNMGKYEACGLNELFRFYKYNPGQRFKMHRDGSYERNETECSFYTFLLYLNDGFEGGETAFENGCTVNPKKGSLLVFHHPLRHEGKILISGIKYALRTDVMYKLAQ